MIQGCFVGGVGLCDDPGLWGEGVIQGYMGGVWGVEDVWG